MHWGLVVDLSLCIGCKVCTVACKQSNNTPVNSWRRIIDCGVSESPERLRLSIPLHCMHCTEPSCMEVCPTKATYRRSDGIVNINYEKCIGCGYCIIACPYDARTITFRNRSDFMVKRIEKDLEINEGDSDRIGVCTKCNFCLPRIEEGLLKGKQPGIDPEATPMCVVSCVSGANHFGDLDDSDSEVSTLIRDRKTIRLNDNLGTSPSVYYLIE